MSGQEEEAARGPHDPTQISVGENVANKQTEDNKDKEEFVQFYKQGATNPMPMMNIDMTDAMESVMNRLVESNNKMLLNMTNRMSKNMEERFLAMSKAFLPEHNTVSSRAVVQKNPEGYGDKAADKIGKENLVPSLEPQDYSHNAVYSAGNTNDVLADDSISHYAPSMSAASRLFGTSPAKRVTSAESSQQHLPADNVIGGGKGQAKVAEQDGSSKHSAHSLAVRQRALAVGEQAPVAADDTTMTMTEEQVYWASQVEDYNDEQKFGPEVSSTIAGATKVFWQKELSEERFKKTLEAAKIPSNCSFLATKQVNKEIWTSTSPDIRSRDYTLQEVQKTHGAMSATILQAVDELNSFKAQTPANNLVKPVIDKLKDALKLAGKANQQMNSHRRESFKTSIPLDLRKLTQLPTEQSVWLFGDNLKDRIAEVKLENSTRNEFTKKSTTYKTKQYVKGGATARYTPYSYTKQDDRQQQSQSSNYKSSQKSRGGALQGYRPKNTSYGNSKNRNQSKRGKK